jgi:hypothetical protein
MGENENSIDLKNENLNNNVNDKSINDKSDSSDSKVNNDFNNIILKDFNMNVLSLVVPCIITKQNYFDGYIIYSESKRFSDESKCCAVSLCKTENECIDELLKKVSKFYFERACFLGTAPSVANVKDFKKITGLSKLLKSEESKIYNLTITLDLNLAKMKHKSLIENLDDEKGTNIPFVLKQVFELELEEQFLKDNPDAKDYEIVESMTIKNGITETTKMVKTNFKYVGYLFLNNKKYYTTDYYVLENDCLNDLKDKFKTFVSNSYYCYNIPPDILDTESLRKIDDVKQLLKDGGYIKRIKIELPNN